MPSVASLIHVNSSVASAALVPDIENSLLAVVVVVAWAVKVLPPTIIVCPAVTEAKAIV